MKVSCIVVNFNGKKFLEECVSSLEKQQFPKNQYEVLIVDNCSTDDSARTIQKTHPFVHLIQLKENLGFAGGVNAGVKHAGGEYVALLNSDAVADPYWLSSFVEFLDAAPNISAANGKTFLYGERNWIQNAGNAVFKDGYSRDIGAVVFDKKQEYEPDSAFFQTERMIAAVSGVSCIMRKDIFLSLGGFDESFFMYYEDIDLSLRMRRMGYSLGYTPKAVALHHHAGTSGEWSPLFLYHTEKNRIALLVKHFPCLIVFSQLIFYKAQTLYACLRWIFGGDVVWKEKTIVRMRVLIWLGSYIPTLLYKRWGISMQAKIPLRKIYATFD